MKLQKQISRKIGNKEYPKWVLVIPPNIIEEAGLRDGDELKPRVESVDGLNRIIIEKIRP